MYGKVNEFIDNYVRLYNFALTDLLLVVHLYINFIFCIIHDVYAGNESISRFI